MFPRSNRKNQIIITVLVLIAIFLMSVFLRESSDGLIHKAQRIASQMLSPITTATSAITRPFVNIQRFVRSAGDEQEENKLLRSEMAGLQAEAITAQQLRRENEELKKMLLFKKESKLNVVGSYVISRPLTPYFSEFTIDRGSREGIKLNMPVVYENALIGKVVQVSPAVSKVELINDIESGVSSVVLRSQTSGILSGDLEGDLRLRFVLKEADVKVGDNIVTAGLGGVYPKGIFIGKVSKVTKRPFGLYQDISVTSPVEFHEVGVVGVITGPSSN